MCNENSLINPRRDHKRALPCKHRDDQLLHRNMCRDHSATALPEKIKDLIDVWRKDHGIYYIGVHIGLVLR